MLIDDGFVNFDRGRLSIIKRNLMSCLLITRNTSFFWFFTTSSVSYQKQKERNVCTEVRERVVKVNRRQKLYEYNVDESFEPAY